MFMSVILNNTETEREFEEIIHLEISKINHIDRNIFEGVIN